MKIVAAMSVFVVIISCFAGCGEGNNEENLCDSPREECPAWMRCKVQCCDDVGMNVEECARAVAGQGYPGFPQWLDCVNSNDCSDL